MSRAPVRLLLCTREGHPTVRPAVAFFYGKYLPENGVFTTLEAPDRAEGGESDRAWRGGGDLVLWPVGKGRGLGRQVRELACFINNLSLLDRGFDAMVVRDRIIASVFGLWACRKRGIPFVYWMSFPYPEDDLLRCKVQGRSLGLARLAFTWLRGHATKLLLYKYLLRKCDHALVITERLKRELTARGLDPARLTPDPMGVDLDLVDKTPREPVADPRLAGRKLLAYLGALDGSRRPEFFLEVLEKVREREPSALLAFIGDAQEEADRQRLEERIRDMGLGEHVAITGWLPRTTAWQWAASARVGLCALPTGFIFATMSPTKAVEFMALKVPVVAANNPDQEELVRRGRAGIAAEYAPEPFARAVLDVLADPGEARAMGERGRAYVEEHRAYRAMAKGLAAFYRKLTGKEEGR